MQESPLPRCGGGGEGRSSPCIEGRIKNPGAPAPGRAHHPGLSPGLAPTRRRSCSGPRARGPPRASVSPPGQRAAARSNLLRGHKRTRQPAKPAPPPPWAWVSPPGHTEPSPHRALQGPTDAKAPGKMVTAATITSRAPFGSQGPGYGRNSRPDRTAAEEERAWGREARLPPTAASACAGRAPRPPFPSARDRTDLRPLPWRRAPRTPTLPASPRRRLELPSGGGGAGSVQAATAARPPARAAAAAAAELVFGGNRGDPRSPRGDWARPRHVTTRLGKKGAPGASSREPRLPYLPGLPD